MSFNIIHKTLKWIEYFKERNAHQRRFQFACTSTSKLAKYPASLQIFLRNIMLNMSQKDFIFLA